MPTSSRPRHPERPATTRRQALAIGAGGPLLLMTSGCGLRLETDPPVPLPPAPPTVDELARERAATSAEHLLDLMAAVRRSRPDAARALGPLDADHRAHLAALRPVRPAPASPAASATTSPGLATATLPRLLAAERSAAAAALADVAGTGATTARLLASVAACLQVHVSVLRALAATAP